MFGGLGPDEIATNQRGVTLGMLDASHVVIRSSDPLSGCDTSLTFAPETAEFSDDDLEIGERYSYDVGAGQRLAVGVERCLGHGRCGETLVASSKRLRKRHMDSADAHQKAAERISIATLRKTRSWPSRRDACSRRPAFGERARSDWPASRPGPSSGPS